jgi:hypothetical protein
MQNNLALHPTSAQVPYLLIYRCFVIFIELCRIKIKTLKLFIWASAILVFLYEIHHILEIASVYPSGEEDILLCWAPKQSYSDTLAKIYLGAQENMNLFISSLHEGGNIIETFPRHSSFH